MCGIAGVVEPVPVADPAALRAVAEAMTATQVLRGPDAGGCGTTDAPRSGTAASR